MEDLDNGMLSQKVIFDFIAGPGPLSDNEIDKIRNILDNDESTDRGTAFDHGQSDFTDNPEVRKSDVCWLDAHTSNKYGIGDVVYRLSDTMDSINNKSFGYELLTFENPQITRYQSSENGFYDWHTDCMTLVENVCRKLSWIIQLSDPSEYEGGQIGMVNPIGEKFFLSQMDSRLLKKGTIIAFPSFMPHTITPVTKGTRYSLVGWCSGPRFK